MRVSELADPLVPSLLDEFSGFAGVVVSGADRSIDVWWKGAVPDRVIAEVAVAQRAGVTLGIHSAAYTRYEMRSASVRILTASDSFGIAGYRLESVRIDEAGRGVYVDYSVADAGNIGTPDDLDATSALGESIRAASPITVLEVRRATGASQVASNATLPPCSPQACRQDDRGPWYGGGLIVSGKPGLVVCSTGFAGTRQSDGGSVMLSAAHCSDWGQSPLKTV